MDIICCDYKSDLAQEAFRLRYEVYSEEFGVNDVNINHEKRIYTDQNDRFAKIYLALKDGKAIATVRSISSVDCDFSKLISPHMYKALYLDDFIENQAGRIAVSDKFAISPDSRGSIAASRVTQRMYQDYLEDDTNFVFCWCAPYLFDFYLQLGFHSYSESVCDRHGFWTPMVLPVRDLQHLKSIKSSLYRQLEAVTIPGEIHPSVEWFYRRYSESIERFVSKKDTRALELILDITRENTVRGHFNILGGMTESDVTDLINSAIIMNVSSGQEVMKNGQVNDEMFLILEGEVIFSLDESSVPLQCLTKGQIFGEISMLTRALRSGYLFASVDAKLAVISRQSLAKLMKTNADLAAKILLNLSRSLALKLQKAQI